MTFEDAWKYSRTIRGWYTASEAGQLWEAATMAKRLFPDGMFVEVGAYCGRSTSLLAQIEPASFLVIEPFILAPNNGNDVPATNGRYVHSEQSRETLHEFLRTMAPVPSVTLFEGKTLDWWGESNAGKFPPGHAYHIAPVSLLHIDGDHTDGVFQDIPILLPLVKAGGLVVFHDFTFKHTHYSRVSEAVRAAVPMYGLDQVSIIDSAIVFRKTAAEGKC